MKIKDTNKIIEKIQKNLKNIEEAFLLYGKTENERFSVDNYVNIENYTESATNEKLVINPAIILAGLKLSQKQNESFVFLHSHPSVYDDRLQFSPLDKNFELNVISMAEKINFKNNLIFLLLSQDKFIGRFYINGIEQEKIELEDV